MNTLISFHCSRVIVNNSTEWNSASFQIVHVAGFMPYAISITHCWWKDANQTFNQIAKRTIFYEMFIMTAFAQVTMAKSNASTKFCYC